MAKKDRHPRYDENGLPIDSREWTEADWQDLYEAMEAVKRKVGGRHGKRPPIQPPQPGERDERT